MTSPSSTELNPLLAKRIYRNLPLKTAPVGSSYIHRAEYGLFNKLSSDYLLWLFADDPSVIPQILTEYSNWRHIKRANAKYNVEHSFNFPSADNLVNSHFASWVLANNFTHLQAAKVLCVPLATVQNACDPRYFMVNLSVELQEVLKECFQTNSVTR